ncbi:hypothetical protein BS78_08G140600 [Paspalum vaginatum]|nr:hypothetical protein BS78_08G140600 [Paspalum vaginatum]
MDRRRRLAALVAAALCLVAAHQGRCRAAARPLHTAEGTSTEAVLDVAAAEAPEAASMWAGGEGEGVALGEGKWLPLPMAMPMAMPAASALAGGLRGFPPVFPLSGGASMPWVPGAPPAFAGLPALVPPFVGATRQEQLSLWASLFNPLQVRPRLPGSLGGETTTAGPAAVPAIASAGNKAAEAEIVDVPAAATATAGAAQLTEPKWGVFLGNVDRRN